MPGKAAKGANRKKGRMKTGQMRKEVHTETEILSVPFRDCRSECSSRTEFTLSSIFSTEGACAKWRKVQETDSYNFLCSPFFTRQRKGFTFFSCGATPSRTKETG